MTHRPLLSVATAALYLFLAGLPAQALPYSADDGGDDQIEGYPTYSSDGALQYSLDEMTAVIAEVYGHAKASEISAACGEGGCIHLDELYSPPKENGVHDYNTIYINTVDADGKKRVSLTMAAMTLYHEYEHARRARSAGEGVFYDPTTYGDRECGPCKHVNDILVQASEIAGALCDEHSSTDEHIEVCDTIRRFISIARVGNGRCQESTCADMKLIVRSSMQSAQLAFLECCEL